MNFGSMCKVGGVLHDYTSTVAALRQKSEPWNSSWEIGQVLNKNEGIWRTKVNSFQDRENGELVKKDNENGLRIDMVEYILRVM